MEERGGNSMVTDNLAQSLPASPLDDTNITEMNDELNWCSVSLSEIIARGSRLEATVYDVEGKKARSIVENCNCKHRMLAGTEGIADAYTCARFKRNWVEKSEFPIYQPSSILELYPKPDGYIARNTDTNIESLRVHKGQVLVTCSGTIGKAAYVSDTLDGKIFSHDLLRISAKNDVDAGYLYAFIKSDIGNKMLTTNQYGAVVSHIEASHLASIPIPYPSIDIRAEISNLIQESFRLRDEANRYLEVATQKLYQELHFGDFWDFKQSVLGNSVNTYSVKLSDLDGRVDASFHNKLATAIIEHIINTGASVQELGSKELSERVFLPQRFKRVYVSKGHGTKMFGIKQITTLDPFTEKYLALGCFTDSLQKELLLEPGMILISRSGTIGNMCIVPPHWKHWIASEDLIRVLPKRNMEGYIYCFLASDYGQALIKRYAFGSVQDHIDCDQVSHFLIPRLADKQMEREINQKVIDCNKLRAQAYACEVKAVETFERKVLLRKTL